jgi:hypothetical protein
VEQHVQKPGVQLGALVLLQRRENVAHVGRQDGDTGRQVHLPVDERVLRGAPPNGRSDGREKKKKCKMRVMGALLSHLFLRKWLKNISLIEILRS